MSVVDMVEGLVDLWLQWLHRPVTDPDRFSIEGAANEENEGGDEGDGDG